MIKPWQKISSEALGDFRIFKIRSDRRISPRTQQPHQMYIIECANWVNVIALTPDQQLVMIEQFRHGSDTVELEIPGGMIDPKDATPEAGAVRELREETGYEGQGPRIIGRVFPNPAIMSNTCFTVLVDNCHLLHPVQWDHGETWLRGWCRSQRFPNSLPEARFATRWWWWLFSILSYGGRPMDGRQCLSRRDAIQSRMNTDKHNAAGAATTRKNSLSKEQRLA